MNNAKTKKFISYCPVDFEDIILSAAFSDIEKGFYIDVGANDPLVRSVTKHFYDNGWSGMNIEPLKTEYELLCKYRPKDINLNIGIADKKGTLEFYIEGAGTTCSQDIIDKHKDKNSLRKESIPVERLADVLDKHINKSKDIHFCKIDVEGFERSVLEGMDFEKHRPFLFCIEATYPGTYISSCHLWEDIFINNDYAVVFSYGVNRYYADKKGKYYNSILANLNAKAPIPASNENKMPFIRKIKRALTESLRFFWRLLPKWFRIKLILPIRLKLQCRKLLKKLNLNYEVTIIS
ncbi:MAG: FkbM family methyltransferase [Endomicrobium sp.]|jgi:FkbM family methyltransferase|nr:FkbM family methyltransferase [Endomicrobium sp.]